MRSLELFSGAGGLAKGLELAGFDHVRFIESNHHACNSLKENFNPDLVFCGDIRNFDFDELDHVDLIAGGPPCQPFSMAGKHMAHGDHRDMFPYAAKAVNHYHPKAFVFENVKGLLRPSFKEYFSYIILRLTFPEVISKPCELWSDHYQRLLEIDFKTHTGTKYIIKYKLINAANYGVPQIRERVFIVGIRSDIRANWHFPHPTHNSDRLYFDQFISGSYWERHGIHLDSIPAQNRAQSKNIENMELALEGRLKPWLTVRDALNGTPHPDTAHDITDHVFRDGARSYPGHTGSYIDLPAKTLKAGDHGVPGGENMIRYQDGSVRYFTVHEGKLLQTFDPKYRITGVWGEGMRQIGNAVPTLLAYKLGAQLMVLLADADLPLTSKPLAALRPRGSAAAPAGAYDSSAFR